MSLRLMVLASDPTAPFPSVEVAARDPNGLLAIGGDLTPIRLLNAYSHGIFPWYSDGQPVLWWAPDPRMVFLTQSFRLTSRFRRSLRKSSWEIRADSAFDAVIDACASIPRAGQRGTWITEEMKAAYRELHSLGFAHSFEVYRDGELIGGIYGVAIGRMFFGESMFSAVSGASKVALAALTLQLTRWGFPLLDAQVENPHLVSFGAVAMPRDLFSREVERLTALPAPSGSWAVRVGTIAARELVQE